jgi:hypothetical protein
VKRRTTRPARAAAALLLVACASCAKLDGLAGGGAPDAASGDGGSSLDAGDATVGEAASDADALDAADAPARLDAADGAPDVDASHPPTFCDLLAQPAAFCADFDVPSSTSPSDGWTSTETSNNGLSFDMVHYLSAIRSLRAQSAAAPSALHRTVMAQTKVTVDLDVDMHSIPDGAVAFVAIGQAGRYVIFFSGGGNLYLQNTGSGQNQFAGNVPLPAPEAWRHATLSVDLGQVPSTMSGAFDGTTAGANVTMNSPMIVGGGAFDVIVGSAFNFGSTSADIGVDNVVVRTQ